MTEYDPDDVDLVVNGKVVPRTPIEMPTFEASTIFGFNGELELKPGQKITIDGEDFIVVRQLPDPAPGRHEYELRQVNP